MQARIQCPFRYARGKQCTGHVTRVEAYKADLEWALSDDGEATLEWGTPRSHFHLFCSEKDNHAGAGRPDDSRLKFYWQELPESLRALLKQP